MVNKSNEPEYNRLSSLPKGWVSTFLQEIGNLLRGVSYKKEEASASPLKGKLPILRANNINGELNFDELVYVPESKIDEIQLIKIYDVIIAMSSGSKTLVGKAAQAKSEFHGGFGAFCGLFRITEKIDKKFIGFFFKSTYYRNAISKVSSGVNINNLRREHIESMPVPLPPLPEQHRIVAKIEELFTKLDAGVEALKKVKAEIRRYRQAVLKHAFEGRLTEEWRKAHKGEGELEPASVLLERIKEERRKSANGKYKEPPPVDTSDLSELPEWWEWARIGEVCLVISGQTPKGVNAVDGVGSIPFYKVSDMNRSGNEKFMDEAEIFLSDENVSQLRINLQRQGTVIFPKRGGAIATNKKRILTRPSAYDLNIMGVYPLSIPSKFFYYWISKTDLMALSDGSNVPQINHKDIDPLIFPLPPLPEQHKIVEEIERHFSLADEVESTVDQSLKQAERLRQSILKRAFKGKLVPQDPADEPAEKLLERIKSEKTNTSNKGKIRQAKRRC